MSKILILFKSYISSCLAFCKNLFENVKFNCILIWNYSLKHFWTPRSWMRCTTYNSYINFTNELIILNSLVNFKLYLTVIFQLIRNKHDLISECKKTVWIGPPEILAHLKFWPTWNFVSKKSLICAQCHILQKIFILAFRDGN